MADTDNNNISNPFERLVQDWEAAKQAKDPSAPFCTLQTVTADGFPTGRILGLREIRSTTGELLLYLNTSSPKYQQLLSTSKYEILLFWTTPHMLQYRVSGTTWSAVDSQELERQWVHKPLQAKLLDYYYENHQTQSTVVEGGRDALVKDMTTLKEMFEDEQQDVLPFPSTAVGLLFQPNTVEEWRASNQDRLHERYLYKRKSDETLSVDWTKQTLVP